jgi:hypothetical protein
MLHVRKRYGWHILRSIDPQPHARVVPDLLSCRHIADCALPVRDVAGVCYIWRAVTDTTFNTVFTLRPATGKRSHDYLSSTF